MITIKNLRMEKDGTSTKLIADISSDFNRDDNEKNIWVSVANEYANMLETKVYNMFLFLPLYMSMFYNSNLHICGPVSKILYNKTDYIQGVMLDFSSKLKKVKVIVDGFGESEGDHNIIGTGISCGVDCLQTIFSHYANEDDIEHRINALFELNCGWHGYINDPNTLKIFKERCEENSKVADDLSLPFIAVDSNLHAFLPKLKDQASYFCIYSCVFALEKGIGKYYISSSYSYYETVKYGYRSRENDFSEFGDVMLLPLAHSKCLEIIGDGSQYKRSEKIELISDWIISKKYLNVCYKNNSTENCSVCHKCVRTLLPLEAMGKLKEYKNVFDIEKYKKIAYIEKCRMVAQRGYVAFQADNYQFCKRNGMKLPNLFVAHFSLLPEYLARLFKKIRRIINRQ
ncbi:MAG: hypothetical protein IJ746_07155 [Ruminococcus sp.]|nr:hypothetical protein [Ruminococcus sp.]